MAGRKASRGGRRATQDAGKTNVEIRQEERQIIPNKEQEWSLKQAIKRAKRNLEIEKYGIEETILDACYEYKLRQDEVYTVQDAVANYLEKNRLLYTNELYSNPEARAEEIKKLRERKIRL